MKFLRGLMGAAFPDAVWEVDLHGMRVPEALETVEKALAAANGRDVRIICGKGRHSPKAGVLEGAVSGWLDAHGYEGRYAKRLDADGLAGSIVVKAGGKRG